MTKRIVWIRVVNIVRVNFILICGTILELRRNSFKRAMDMKIKTQVVCHYTILRNPELTIDHVSPPPPMNQSKPTIK